MPGTYNANANAILLADQLARNPKLQAEFWSRKLSESATMHNAFEAFTSSIEGRPEGVTSIFAKKNDLAAGGGQRINFTVIGTPGGPGVKGAEELSGNTSVPLQQVWGVDVEWQRDAVEWTKDVFEMLAAGKQLESTSLRLLGKKMGINRQNMMMMKLFKQSGAFFYRPNNRASTNALLSTDVLSLNEATVAREQLGRRGAQSVQSSLGPNGSPIDGYLIFGGRTAFLPIRNDDGFQLALSNGGVRGNNNPLFKGSLVDFQGMPFFEMRQTHEAWDDYIGDPMNPLAKNAVEFSIATAAGDCQIIANASNLKHRYTQFFPGYAYKFLSTDTPSPDSTEYYAWACNPDGSRAFLAYTGSGNNGNRITITKILATTAGTSTKGNKTVGLLTTGTSPTVSSNVITPDSDSNLPLTNGGTAWVYTDKVQAGAIIVPANSRGTTYGRSFGFGAMSGAFAYGRIEKARISQERDYGFVIGRGYEEIFGVGVPTNALGEPNGYLVIEHAIEHPLYPCPSI